MIVDLIFVNENTPERNVSVIKYCKTIKEAQTKFNELDKTTTIEYAYIRHFSGWRHHIVKWLKRKDEKKV